MKISVVHGRQLVVQHFFPTNCIVAGQIWAPADGVDREVIVLKVDLDNNEVVYQDHNSGPCAQVYEKDSFSFQTRYCLVV